MLDLTTRTNSKKLYEIKMPDGQELKLKLPTQSLLMKLNDIQAYVEQDPISALTAINNLVVQILNQNTQGVKYTEEQLMEMLDLDTLILIINDYITTTTKTLGE